MADPRDPKAPKASPSNPAKTPAKTPAKALPEALPFAGEERDWEDELAAWDASLPIEQPALVPLPAASSGPAASTGPSTLPGLAPLAPDGLMGAVPEEENPFADTPTTVVSTAPEGIDVEDFTESVEELSEAAAPNSGVYATMVSSSVDVGASLFQRDPPPEAAAPIFAEGVAEMAGDAWRQGPELLVKVPARGARSAPPDGDWRAAVALFRAEAAATDDVHRRVELTLAAARASEMAGDTEGALSLYDRALVLEPQSAAALRARLRLIEMAGGRGAAARETLGRLCTAVDGEERALYRAIDAEWALATTGRLDRAGLTALGDGLGRTLAEAEIALRQDQPGEAAAALDRAARSVGEGSEAGGAVAGALAAAAARLYEVAGDFAAAAGEHLMAERFDRGQLPVVFGRLRDAARAGASAEASLTSMLLLFPSSDLKVSLARWAAALARGAGAPERAVRLLADPTLGPGSRALLRDRIDLAGGLLALPGTAGAGGGPPAADALELLQQGATAWPAPEDRAGIDLTAFALAAQGGDERGALQVLERGLTTAPDAVPLALAAERLARATKDAGIRCDALRLWGRHDPARTAHASSLLVEALIATGAAGAATDSALPDGGGDDAIRAALRSLVAEVPIAPAFWTLAARERSAGRRAEAAAAIEAGARAWSGSALAPALETLAVALRMEAPPPSAEPLPARADRRGRMFARLRALPGAGATAAAGRREALAAALDAAGDDPAALALLTLDAAAEPARLAAAYQAAGARAGVGRLDGERWTLHAILWLARAGEAARARALAAELHGKRPESVAARVMARRLARTAPDAAERAQALARLGFDPHDAAELLSTAEALEDAPQDAGNRRRAEAIFRQLDEGPGPLGIEARRGLARVQADAPGGGGAPAASPPLDEPQARLRRFLDAARTGEIAKVIAMLEKEPPQEEAATAPSLYLGALLAEGRAATGAADGTAGEAARLVRAAMAFEHGADRRQRPGLLCAWRAADDIAKHEPASRALAAALATVATKLVDGDSRRGEAIDGDGGGSDGAGVAAATDARRSASRSAATLLVRAAEADAAAGASAAAEERLRQAIERDPACLPALMALRRALVRRGALADAAAVCEQEAAAVSRAETRVRLLHLAASLASAVDRRGDAPPATRATRLARAAGPLRKVLAIDPANVEAFEQLRAIFTEIGEPAKLSEVLAGRIAVASNPFEITSLRMARAELLAGPLASHAAAKAELAAILQKEPQHGRALARLSDLQYEDGAYADAAETYLARALVERSPEQLREIFLRLGRIYTRHVHDAKRAADAWKRVLQLETNNREALAALSDLLVELGDTKNAIAVTERLADQDPGGERAVPYLIRLGQLCEQAGDLRRAGARFRQAADAAPRNVQAVGEMVRHLERTRDPLGRRALLDNALLLLRGDLQAGKLDLASLRALVSIQQWRGKVAAGAAGAQLLAALSPEAADRDAVAPGGWAAPPARGRPLGTMKRPEIDERLFPPGLPSGVRNIFRLLGEPLSKGPVDLKRYELARGDQIARGQPPRDVIDPIVTEAGVRHMDVFVKPARGDAAALMIVEPGDPPALVLGERIVKMGPHAVRFAAGRAARLCSTYLDLVLRGTPAETGALVGGVVRQFVADYRHPEVPNALLAARADSLARLLSRRLKQDVMPFAVESAGGFDLGTLHAAVRDGANRVGLLASADLAACAGAVLAAAGRPLALPDLVASPEAMALCDFALSDGYDDLYREMD